jgi:hypothetical protein
MGKGCVLDWTYGFDKGCSRWALVYLQIVRL